MADRLYLSLWYPNFRLEALPAALTGVLRQFALVGGKRVAAASAYPINFTQPPTYQRIYVDSRLSSATDPTQIDPHRGRSDAGARSRRRRGHRAAPRRHGLRVRDALAPVGSEEPDPSYSHLDTSPPAIDDDAHDPDIRLDEPPSLLDPDTDWKLRTHTVRVLGFGPNFDVAGYEQNGHLWSTSASTPPGSRSIGDAEDEALDQVAQIHIQQNIEKLLAFTLLVEKNCGISSRLLWTESGEPLAEKLIARLQRVH
jgi:hypothetical protein